MHACPAPLLPPCPSLFSRVAASLQQPVSPFLPPNRPPLCFHALFHRCDFNLFPSKMYLPNLHLNTLIYYFHIFE